MVTGKACMMRQTDHKHYSQGTETSFSLTFRALEKKVKPKPITIDFKLTVPIVLSVIDRSENEMIDFFKYESRKYPKTLLDDQGRI